MNEVINVSTLKSWTTSHVYVGRSRLHGGSVLGNQWTHIPLQHTNARYQVATAEEAVEHYKVWLRFRIQLRDDEEVLRALAKIRSTDILVCHCMPAVCHATVIAQAVEYLDSKSPAWWIRLVEEERGIPLSST